MTGKQRPDRAGLDDVLDAALAVPPADGNVDPRLAEKLATIQRDPERARKLDTALRALAVVDALPAPEPSPFLARKLARKLDDIDRRSEFWQPQWGAIRWAGGLSLAAIAVGVALLVVPPNPKSTFGPAQGSIARIERLELAEDQEIFENLDILEHLDVLDDIELIESLPEEKG